MLCCAISVASFSRPLPGREGDEFAAPSADVVTPDSPTTPTDSFPRLIKQIFTDTLSLMPDTPGTDSIPVDSLGSDSVDTRRRTVAPVSENRRRLSRRRIEAPPTGVRIVRDKVDLDNSVDFSAKDSLILMKRDTAFMYGDSKVTLSLIHISEPTRP